MRRIEKVRKEKVNTDGLVVTDLFNSSCKSVRLFDFDMILPGNSTVRTGKTIRIKQREHIDKDVGEDILPLLRDAVHDCGGFDGVMASGGIDSSLIAAVAKEENANCKLFVSGFRDSDDIKFSKILGETLRMPVNEALLSDEKIEEIVSVLKSIGLDTYSVIIGITEYSAIELAASGGYKKLLSGIGSDELFFGFGKHREETSVESLKSLRKSRLSYMAVTDILRLKSIGDKLGVAVALPYLNEKIVNFALNMHIDATQYTYRKTPLRDAGRRIGLDERIVERNKKAMQYGSGVVKRLEKIAAKHGVKNVGEYIKTI